MGHRARSDRVPRWRSIFRRRSPDRAISISTHEVKSDLGPGGSALPLGGSTGSLIQLANGMTLTVTIDYQGQSNPDIVNVAVSNLISATDPMPAVATPANVVGTFQVTDDGQDGTGQHYEQGFVHLVVTAPGGVVFDSATFAQVLWQLSDPVGTIWDSTYGSIGHDHIYATCGRTTENIVDLYFPPVRDEAPAARINHADNAAPGVDSGRQSTSMRHRSWERIGT